MFKFNYEGYYKCKSVCGVEIMRDGVKATVILTELEENNGTSVTNIFEHIATQIYYKFLDTSHWNITWIEHHPETKFRKKETFAKVTMDWDGKTFSSPKWQHLEKVLSYWELAQIPDDYSR